MGNDIASRIIVGLILLCSVVFIVGAPIYLIYRFFSLRKGTEGNPVIKLAPSETRGHKWLSWGLAFSVVGVPLVMLYYISWKENYVDSMSRSFIGGFSSIGLALFPVLLIISWPFSYLFNRKLVAYGVVARGLSVLGWVIFSFVTFSVARFIFAFLYLLIFGFSL